MSDEVQFSRENTILVTSSFKTKTTDKTKTPLLFHSSLLKSVEFSAVVAHAKRLKR